MSSNSDSRRPIQARGNASIRRFAAALARTQLTPNQISIASVLFAAGGAAALLWPPAGSAIAGLLLCALGVQLRLLCNVLDGLVAVEGGKSSVLGALYNEYPDRIADSLLIVALGIAAGHAWLGWLGALLAALTAYVRMSGGALGLPQSFRGPLAKQQRMAVLSLGCVAGVVEHLLRHSCQYSLWTASVLIAAGSLLTCMLRSRDIARALEQRAAGAAR